MKIIVDTCVWSLALRRDNKSDDPVVTALKQLIHDARVQLLGPIRQEILSGIKSTSQFDQISEILRAFPDTPLLSNDYELAAKFFNRCRGKGIQGSNTDFLICSVADRLKMPIFTVDNDFLHFSVHLPIHLFMRL
ncbi:MAG: PIN domain-containing protein [Desulfatitalea sp.]|nr:PIN domain-containing protein [Desulfatitalea sp.]NNJ99438.1 PIN domain-containing protein [Desulfatitalea sp.]